MNIKNLIVFISIPLMLTSCFNTSNSCDATYFGGQIINPNQKFVTLSKNDVVIDTMYLDRSNNFFTQLKTNEGGLYTFNYGNEFQYIYFEPRDSILIRLNTWDFDESLVFSGRGAEKNNFLITLYLQNEKDGQTFSPYYNLESDKFEEKIAASEKINHFLYDQLKESGVEISPKFNELAQVAISYSLYSNKEYYPMIYKSRLQLKDFPKVSKKYYDFRKNIDLNNKDLIYYAPYNRYVSSYIQATAYHQKKKNSNYTLEVLKIITKNIKIDKLKNNLLYQTIYNDFRKSQKACFLNQEALVYFNENCNDKKYVERVNALAKDCKNIDNNSNLDNFDLTSLAHQKTKINSIIKNKNTVIYFWSPVIISPDMLVKKVKYLKNKYPELLFVGINLDSTEHSNRINKQLDHQFILPQNSGAHNYVSSFEPRTILIDKNGIIFNSFTYLSSYHIEKQLSELEKR